MLIQINRQHPQPRVIEMLATALNDGGLIAAPTDTTYGIAAHIFKKKAIERIYMLKNHKRNKPLSLLCADISQVTRFAFVDDNAFRFMKRCLPGPYTFILNATREAPHTMVSKRKTVGIRVPDEPVIQGIIESLGDPLISTSAMSQQRTVLDSPSEIQRILGHALNYIVDVGEVLYEPSTVIDLTGAEPVLIRAGKGPIEPLGFEPIED